MTTVAIASAIAPTQYETLNHRMPAIVTATSLFSMLSDGLYSTMLTPVDEKLWIVDGPTVSFYSFPYPTRMAVARLPDRKLWLWSPIELTVALADALEELGEVSFLVAPNKLHHLFLDAWAEQYPTARLYAAPGLAKKRRDLSFAAELGDAALPEWQGAIDQVVVGGSFAMDEVVFFHRPSRSALVCDLIQKHDKNAFSGWRRWAMQLDGMVGPDGSTPREWRATFTRRTVARAALNTVLEWNPERLILAHGPIFRSGAREIIASSLAWIG